MKYKVKVKDTAPVKLEQIKEKKCFLGISINNPLFLDDKVQLILSWISKRFDNCHIIIGDHLHRINEYIINGISGQEAIENAKIPGKNISDKLTIEIKNFPDKLFCIEFWEKYSHTNEYEFEHEKLVNYFNNNIIFKNTILNSATQFIDKQISRGCNFFVEKDIAIKSSIEYLLEEMAVFSVIIGKGYKVQVYPGTQLSILKEIANGEFSELNTNLKDGIYIDLTVKKK